MTQPYLYQLKGVRQMFRFARRNAGNVRCLNATEMGLGKSFMSLLAMKRLEVRPVVVVCPAGLKWQWSDEAAKHVGLMTEVLNGTRPPKNPPMAKRQLLIVNYDILHEWVPHLKNLHPGLVVADEVHYAKSRSARRSKALAELCREVPHVIGLSGTPITNRPAELWPILNLLRPDLFPSFHKFAWAFCKPKRTPWGWDFSGASNLDQLHESLRENMMIRYRKVDVLQDLPRKIRTVVPLEIDRIEYDKAVNDFIGWLRETSPKRANKAAKAEAVVKIGYLKRLAAHKKMPGVYDWIDDFLEQSDGKLLVFAIHKKIIRRLEKRYRPLCVVVDGSVTGEKRMLAVRKFQTHPKCRVFIGNVKAAGVGLNLTAASTVCFTELPWVPSELTQAEDRCWARLNDLHGASVYYLVAKDTCEAKLLKILQKKQKVANLAIDGGEAKGDRLDVFDLLTRSLLKDVSQPLFSRKENK